MAGTKSHKLFFFIPEIAVFLKTCQLSQQFFWETTFLLVKPIWGYEKHHLRSSFLLLQSDVKIYRKCRRFILNFIAGTPAGSRVSVLERIRVEVGKRDRRILSNLRQKINFEVVGSSV